MQFVFLFELFLSIKIKAKYYMAPIIIFNSAVIQ